MPELPEVETTVRALREPLVGRTIVEVCNDWSRHIATPELPELRTRIRGRRIERIDRRGKYLVFTLNGDETLIIHLKMTGHLSVVDESLLADPYAHTVFVLDNGQELRFRDPRKFGRVYLVHNPQEVLGRLGPEPLEPDFTVDVLRQRLQRRTRSIKPLLLDQGFIAGVGNIYADEALYYAGLHPLRCADSLSAADIAALHVSIRKVLQMGIAREGASIDRYRKPDGTRGDMQNVVAVFQRTGEPCFRCETGVVQRIILGGRGTHFCPVCQT